MSQDYHQGLFYFSNGVERSQQQQQIAEQIRKDKIRVPGFGQPPLIGMEEDGSGYEAPGILSEMFNFHSGTATEMQSYRNPTDWFLHRHNQSVVDDTASYDSAAAMQLFHMNPQRQNSPPSASSSLHLLLPNHNSHTASGGAFGQFTYPIEVTGVVEGKGLSLSLSSSLEAAKAEELMFGSTPAQYQSGAGVGLNTLRNSKYAKAAQGLLEEICSVGRGHFNKTKTGRHKNPSGGGSSSSTSRDCPPLSASNRVEHQRRKVKLISILDEVERRYNHYCEQMQMVVNSFDMIMGYGAAAPYTSLAQKAMSRHFRCLKDAVTEQLKHSCEMLGEKESSATGLTKGETPRLRALEQSLRQQRAFGQMEQEAWRPQRGLPERSVGILRAWLFEHFLNPYPSDADKHLLARQTGLSRNQRVVVSTNARFLEEDYINEHKPNSEIILNELKGDNGTQSVQEEIPQDTAQRGYSDESWKNQVSNWFINARVRLWKPMVEQMYLQEFKDEDRDDTNGDQTSATAQTPTPQPTFTSSPAPKRSQFNAHENDPSFVSINAPDGWRRLSGSGGIMRFGTAAGDVSLTLGLRHAGNLPEKTPFSVADSGRC